MPCSLGVLMDTNAALASALAHQHSVISDLTSFYHLEEKHTAVQMSIFRILNAIGGLFKNKLLSAS